MLQREGGVVHVRHEMVVVVANAFMYVNNSGILNSCWCYHQARHFPQAGLLPSLAMAHDITALWLQPPSSLPSMCTP
jgi:hypothetical protein